MKKTKEKKRWFFFFFIAVLFLFGAVQPVSAEEDGPLLSEEYEEYFESSGANELYGQLPEDAQDFLKDSGIDSLSSEQLLNLDFQSFLSVLLERVVSGLKKPLIALMTTVGMVLLASVMGMFRSTIEGESGNIFTVVVVLGISTTILTPVVELIQNTVSMIEQMGDFVLGFIPVYTGIVAVSGKPVSAFTYHTLLLTILQVLSYVTIHVLIPLICIYLALSIVGSVSTQIDVSGIAKTIRTAVIWCLGLFLTVFVSMLTIKSFVAASADTVTFRAGKFLVGSLVPIVGGAVSEAMTVVQGSLGVIRSSVGAFGILSIVITFLPVILGISLMSMALKLSQAISDSLKIPQISSVLEAAGFVLSLLLAVLICFAVMLIVSISLMLVLGSGA